MLMSAENPALQGTVTDISRNGDSGWVLDAKLFDPAYTGPIPVLVFVHIRALGKKSGCIQNGTRIAFDFKESERQRARLDACNIREMSTDAPSHASLYAEDGAKHPEVRPAPPSRHSNNLE
jgi:hypothetical protein